MASSSIPGPAGPDLGVDLDDERQRIEAAQAGNLDAMRPLLERYAQPLYGTVILPRIGNVGVAEELLRDSLSTAVEKIGSFTWQGKSMYPWLRQIAVNKVFDKFREGTRQRRLVAALTAEAVDSTDISDGADAQLMADEERAQHRARIVSVLADLNPRYRKALELRLLDEQSREECAAELGITVPTFDVLLFRAVRAFRKQYGAFSTGTSTGNREQEPT